MSSKGKIEAALTKRGIVFLDIPTGRGRSHTLAQLKAKVSGPSVLSFYYSPETGVGQLLHDVLNVAGPGFLSEFPEAGPVIRRYLHHRYCPMLNGFKPYRPLTRGQEQELVLNTLVYLVRFANIEYWFIDDWLQDDYNPLMSVVLPRLVETTGLSVVVTGDAFPKEAATYVLTTEDLGLPKADALLDLWQSQWGFDRETALQVAAESLENWHEALFLMRTGTTKLSEAVRKVEQDLSDDAKAVARSAAVLASRVSDFLMGILLEGRSEDVPKELETRRLVFKEGPLNRFPSERVRSAVLEAVPLETRYRLSEELAEAVVRRRYEDYWERISQRYQQLGKTEKETYTLLMALRHEKGTPKAKSIINRLDQIGLSSPGYTRLKAFCLYINNEMKEAAETLRGLKRLTLVDKANMIRMYVYAGELGKAEELVRDLRSNFQAVRGSLFLPKVAAELPLVDVFRGETAAALDEAFGVMTRISEGAFMREHVAAYYNSLAVMLGMNGETRHGYNYFMRAWEAAQPLESSEVHLKILVNLADTALELEGPLDSYRYVSLAVRSNAPCSLPLRVVALVNYLMAHFELMGLSETTVSELQALAESADSKTKFDALEALALTRWLSGHMKEAAEIINSLQPPGRSEQQRLLALRGFLDDFESLSQVEFIDSSMSAFPILWGFRNAPQNLRRIRLLASDRPLLRFLKAYELGKLDQLVGIATEAELKWYLADAMFMYELLAESRSLQSKVPLLEEASRLAGVLGLSNKVAQLDAKVQEAKRTAKENLALRMLERSLLSMSVEQMEVPEFLSCLESMLSHYYDRFYLSFGIGGRSYRLGRENTRGQALEMYLQPFSGTLILPEVSDADVLVLRAVLMAAARRWKIRYGTMDALTGLYNRTYGEDVLAQAWGDYTRNGRTFVVAYLDVNEFKRINDTYGHAVGDEVLRVVARVLRDSVRKNDSVIRWGGDEFLLILRDTDKHGARRVIDRVQRTLKQLERPLEVSYGIVEPAEVDSLNDLVGRADQLMYAHKRGAAKRVRHKKS
ncbi:GGDEF domain-containing protein [Coprothermobacteraceae bacterium]|nr:GGDEF domain-containing protein [Coprothermobacteraceae bacterium]